MCRPFGNYDKNRAGRSSNWRSRWVCSPKRSISGRVDAACRWCLSCATWDDSSNFAQTTSSSNPRVTSRGVATSGQPVSQTPTRLASRAIRTNDGECITVRVRVREIEVWLARPGTPWCRRKVMCHADPKDVGRGMIRPTGRNSAARIPDKPRHSFSCHNTKRGRYRRRQMQLGVRCRVD